MYDLGETDWRATCKAQGGVATVNPNDGTPACRLPNGSGGWQYVDMRSLSEKIADATAIAEDDAWMAAGGVVDAAQSAIDATGLNNGVSGVLSTALGIPRWMLIALGGLAAYGVGVEAGVLPPMRRIFK